MKYLVTGATGFIGSAVARRLVRRGHTVRALVRPGSEKRLPADPSIEVLPGDVTDPVSVKEAVRGIDGLFHVAAVYSYWHPDPAETYRTNVDGTAMLLREARAAGVSRAVVTSTVATLKWPGKGRLADEAAVASIDELPGHYKRSKLLAEQAALSLNGHGFEVVIVNPTAPFGPRDARPTPTGRIVIEFLNRRFPGYVDTGLNVCDVSDVAEGHLLAFEKGRAGERYILGSENVTLRGIYDLLGEVTGLGRRPVRVPHKVALFAGAIDTLIEGRILRREPFIPVEGLQVARHPMFVDCSKAVIELGLPQRPAAESLHRAADWFARNGYTKARPTWPAWTGTQERADKASIRP
ncbi:MAG: NAD-dependent epimerase/dehydratase family protein [Chloroflexi bacterium]|nr:NAD-dependent epimerase/dehydratase family protein [Chloroflexota bacterium]MDA1296546.1 NAD-dependent epimerase/dehydratase family protein [Chloroflexota bacterium]